MPLDGNTLDVALPEAFAPFFAPARYKGAFGGRGGAKSHAFATMVVLRAMTRPTRIVCIREVQRSIAESVKQLITDKIKTFGLEALFTITRDEIRHPNGSLIIFRGMQAFNAHNIKSLEGFDVAWIEEAQSFSAVSLLMLRPTLRKEGSELWFTWNPRNKSDPVDALLRGPKPPRDAIVIEVGWRDNPWFTRAMRQEMDEDYARDPDAAQHVWGGGYQTVGLGAYYARLIQAAEKDGRIGDFPYDPSHPVMTSWDLGVDDYTSVWFWQEYDGRATVIDFFETQNTGLDAVVGYGMPELLADEAEGRVRLQELERDVPFQYGAHWLPHDVAVRELGSGARERATILRELGLKDLRKGVRADPERRIAASRKLLPLVRFNKTARVEAGIEHLRGYAKKVDRTTGLYLGPDKNGHDHAADAFGEFAINCPLLLRESAVERDQVDDINRVTLSDILQQAFEEQEADDAD